MFELEELVIGKLHRTDITYLPANPVWRLTAFKFFMARPAIKVYRVYRN